jgi:FtsP/CotA-like multicopper oxidase with cupredoxin domain
VNQQQRSMMGRRSFLKATGAAAVTATAGLSLHRMLPSNPAIKLTDYSGLTIKRMHIAATDGWVSMPTQVKPIPPFFPDPDAPDYTAGRGYYVMGFRDVTAYAPFVGDKNTGEFPLTAQVMSQKMRAQISAPHIYTRVGEDLRLHLTNLGLARRPDLVDTHTIHFHGFPNQTVYFDGVPDNSLSAPIGRTLVYRYIPEDPGTYMYHCHFDDVEHVGMGLRGMAFVLPSTASNIAGTQLAYDYQETFFHRQFAILLTEDDPHLHYNDAHLQINDFSGWAPMFTLMNGRAWPDTIEANIDPANGNQLDGKAAGGPLPRLQYNPNSSLIQANSGESILIRVANLGYDHHSLVLPGLSMRMVGRDAKPLVAGRPDYLAPPPATGAYAQGTRGDITVTTNRIDIGPGESRDLIFVAPAVSQKTVFPFYDRDDSFVADNGGVSGDGYGGMRTEVHVFPSGLAPQSSPNQLNAVHGDM